MESLNDYMGEQFEKICMQFLRTEAKARKLPFVPQKMGRWWGTNIFYSSVSQDSLIQ